jgi:hypothetical protein
MMAGKRDFVIEQGKTFQVVLRWGTQPTIFKPITGITQTAPANITATGHGLTDGWRAAVVSVKGMTDINAQNSPPKDSDYHPVTVVDANTVQMNDVNAAGYKVYSSGGYLQFDTPVDLSGYTPRMKIKDKIGGVVLASTEAGDSPLNIITVALDNNAKTITITISAASTEDITWKKGVYDFEMEKAGIVTALLAGSVSVTKEVTTS